MPRFAVAVGFKDVATAGFSTFPDFSPLEGQTWMLKSINIQDDASKFPLCMLAINKSGVWSSVGGVGTPMKLDAASMDHGFYSELNKVVGSDDVIRVIIVTNVNAARVHYTLHYEVI